MGVDLHPKTPAEMLADYLVHPANLRNKGLPLQPLGEQLAPQQPAEGASVNPARHLADQVAEGQGMLPVACARLPASARRR